MRALFALCRYLFVVFVHLFDVLDKLAQACLAQTPVHDWSAQTLADDGTSDTHAADQHPL